MKSKIMIDSYPGHALLEIDYFQYIIDSLPISQQPKLSFKKTLSFPDIRIMVWFQILVMSNTIRFTIINYDFKMLVDV